MNTAKVRWLGALIALLSAVSYSLNLALASFAYQHGANPHAVNLVRSVFFLICLFVLIKLMRLPFRLNQRQVIGCIVAGSLLCLQIYAMLNAIRYMPVGLSVVVLYTYPLCIAIYAWLSGREVWSNRRAFLLISALCGVWLVAVTDAGNVEWQGFLLAAIGALTLASVLLVSERAMADVDSKIVMFYMMLTTSVILTAFSIAGAPLHWPAGPTGWLGFSGATLFFVIGTFSLFSAVSLIGPLRTAIIDNSAPVWAICFGLLLLNEQLGKRQLMGSVLVIFSLLLLQIPERKPNVHIT